MDQPAQQKEIWLTFVGIIDQPVARGFATVFANMVADKVTRVHLLLQSTGGSINDGVFLFNYFNSVPIEVFTYNCGNVSSAAVTAYLGAKKRLVSPDGTFLPHRATSGPSNGVPSEMLAAAAASVQIDNARVTEILKSSIELTAKQWKVFAQADLVLDAKSSIAAGIAHEIGHFNPNGILLNL